MKQQSIFACLHGKVIAPVIIVIIICLLPSCFTVGPNYTRPALPASNGYSSVPLPSTTVPSSIAGKDAQRFVLDRDIQADWWTLFQSPPLNAFIAKALVANPNIKVAQATLRAAQENVYAQRGFFFPTVQASYSPTRTMLPGNLGGDSPGIQGNGSVISTFQGIPASEGGTPPFTGPVTYNFHTAQLTVGYIPDVFGANRRQIESLESQAKIQQFQLEATIITLASNIVAASIQDALLRQQIATVNEIIEDNVKTVNLMSRRYKAGFASHLDLAIEEHALAQERQLLPPLEKQFEQNRNLLRLLSGGVQDSAVPAFELDALQLPTILPLSVPSKLVEQRPDVRAAEEQLHAACAQVGVARAARLPGFPITAVGGGTASYFSQMFWNSGQFFNLALDVAQPIFNGSILRHREYAARATLRQTAAQYRTVVIAAFQNVADTLQALHADAKQLGVSNEAKKSAKTIMELIRRQHAHGHLDRLAFISAQQNYRRAKLEVAQARASRLGDTAALFQVLGGGWWHRTPTPKCPS